MTIRLSDKSMQNNISYSTVAVYLYKNYHNQCFHLIINRKEYKNNVEKFPFTILKIIKHGLYTH